MDDLEELKEAVKSAAEEAVGERLNEFESRLVEVEKSLEDGGDDTGSSDEEGEGDESLKSRVEELESQLSTKDDEIAELKSFRDGVEKTVSSRKSISDDGDGDGGSTNGRASKSEKARHRDSLGRRVRSR